MEKEYRRNETFDQTLFVGHGKICLYELLHTAEDERRNE